MSGLDGPAFRRMVIAAADAVDREEGALSKLDAVAGDGDHGVNLRRAMDAARKLVDELPPASPPGAVLHALGEACAEQMGGAAGALFGAYFRAAAASVGNDLEADVDAVAEALAAGLKRVQQIGKASVGDKTMVDALAPAAEAAAAAAGSSADPADALADAAAAARRGAERTRDLVPGAGRARYAADRASGTADPGATAVALILDAWARAAEDGRPMRGESQ